MYIWFGMRRWKKKAVFMFYFAYFLSGMAGRSGGALSLQHTLLLPWAGQRGGGGWWGGRRDVAWRTDWLSAGGRKQYVFILTHNEHPDTTICGAILWIRTPELLLVSSAFLSRVSNLPGSGGQPEEAGEGGGSFPVHAEKWWAVRT